MADVEFELQSDLSSLEQKTWNSAALAPEQTSKHALVFSVAEQNFAIAADYIEQIVELPKIAHVPAAGLTLLGLADHDGQPIPVVDIAPLLEIDAGIETFRHGLLLNHRGFKVMLAIEAVVVLRELPGKPGTELVANHQATAFANYTCELAIADNFSLAAGGRSIDAVSPETSSTDTPAKSAGKLVVVLDVSELLIAIRNEATARPVS